MWMTRKRFERMLDRSLNGGTFGKFSASAGGWIELWRGPAIVLKSAITQGQLDAAIAAALKPYAHLICEHDFKSKDSACPAFVCAKCGTRNPKWEWRSLSGFWPGMGPRDGEDGWHYAMSVIHEPWYYRDWPKPKRSKRAR